MKCIGIAFVKEIDTETADGIFRKLLGDAVEPDIKILADKITGHPEHARPIETLAADIFVSKYYLIRKFKRSVGMTPHQFRIQNRIRKAQRLLDAEQAVGRIAAETGFYDQSHFDRAFQRIVGISPSEYVNSKRRMKGPA